ncbi:MAG: type III-B CRISPR module RAMP protein Cmr4 [Chloroflexi bacterium SZAS-1]|nr:type III-B CRISPR module RAMP protein Cmr4 [Chloroflexi bacterium SZAS-1]
MTTRLLFIHALSALHAGTGQGVGVIDLPIARETATGLPYLPGSSIKGTLRDSPGIQGVQLDSGCIREDEKQVIFGPPTDYASDNAGSAQFADARLLLLPVRSLAGTFAWVTSPYVLQRFARDAGATDVGAINTLLDWNAPGQGQAEQCKLAADTKLKLTDDMVVLEDFDLVADEAPEVANIADTLGEWLFPDENNNGFWRNALKKRLCVVRDDVLTFLLTTATEVIARIKLKGDTKTVDTETGALWYEEALPAESILYGLVVATPIMSPKVRDFNPVTRTFEKERLFTKTVDDSFIFNELAKCTTPALQFGGKATVGRGVCRTVLVKGK